jgi:hypothetical protein
LPFFSLNNIDSQTTRIICLFGEKLTLRSHGGSQVEQDADMLSSFCDRLECAGRDIHMLFFKHLDVKKLKLQKVLVKNLFFGDSLYFYWL